MALEADYVTVDLQGLMQNILMHLYFDQNWQTQQSHGLFVIAELLVHYAVKNVSFALF